ncbi:hypothetical protein FB45DRAFT_180391 [Roridomyces roridus]|uniref:Uncharacterized protein n=1 Tax=Roridomyces roridus TaxID=1738132 RepID=A0AAD7CE09_9AGAR|nr:hypothetical protein FB45DRAFT_180391 [Roridomyces roridus]
MTPTVYRSAEMKSSKSLIESAGGGSSRRKMEGMALSHPAVSPLSSHSQHSGTNADSELKLFIVWARLTTQLICPLALVKSWKSLMIARIGGVLGKQMVVPSNFLVALQPLEALSGWRHKGGFSFEKGEVLDVRLHQESNLCWAVKATGQSCHVVPSECFERFDVEGAAAA